VIVADTVRRALAEHATNIAIRDDSRSRTYAEVGERSHRLVDILAGHGLVVGDRVATLAANDLTTLELMLGLALGGYARTALHAMGTGEAHRQTLEAAGARALITTRDFYDRFGHELRAARGLELILVQGGDGTDALDYERAIADADPTDRHIPVSGDDILHLAYSSGSSGRPRASVHTQASWSVVTTDNATFLPRVTSADVYLAAAPLTHAASTVLFLLVARGASITILDHFDAGRAIELIERDRVTMTFVVPTMLQSIVSHPAVASADLSSLRVVMYASAPISVETALAAQRALGDVLFQSYGQSECLPATCLTPEDHARGAAGDARILRSAGRVCLNARVRIVADDGTELPPGGIGEILISTEGRMRGIYGDPELTAKRITPDGFVHTNDIGHLDADGYLFVVDRKDDMIISGGFNIWPAEIEQALASHPDVVDAVAVGIPHQRWGETPVAVVVVREGADVRPEDLIEACREQLGSMKKPSMILIRTEPLPRNQLGKRSRRELREAFWPGAVTADRQVSGA
jgi:acyl-CoA synthetase (AMP-forming)/AMP-acid ligase II